MIANIIGKKYEKTNTQTVLDIYLYAKNAEHSLNNGYNMNTQEIDELKKASDKLYADRDELHKKIRLLQLADAEELKSQKVEPILDVDGAFQAIQAAMDAEKTIKAEIKRLKKEQKTIFNARDKYAELILEKLNAADIHDENGNELSASDDVYIDGDSIMLESGQSSCCMGGVAAVSIRVTRKALEMSVAELAELSNSADLEGLVDVTVHELEYDGESSWNESHNDYDCDDDED